MKIKLLLISLVLSFAFYGQVINKAFHTGYLETSGMVSINQKSYWLETYNTRELKLHCIDNSGQKLFSTDIMDLPWTEKVSIAVTGNKQLLITGGTPLEGCDYGTDKLCFFWVDTNGTTISTFSVVGDVRAWATQSPGHFLFYMNDEVRRYDNSGNYLTTLPIDLVNNTLGAPMEMLGLASGKFIVSYLSGSAGTLRKTNSTGTSMVEVVTPNICSHLREAGDSSIYALSNGHVVKYSSQLGLLHSSASLSQSGTINTFTIHNDTVFAAGQNAQHEFYYLVLDSALSLLHYANSNIQYCTPTGISVSGSKTKIITTGGTPGVLGQTFTGWFQTSKTGTLGSTQDVGIIDVALDKVVKLVSAVPMAQVMDATVTVKNFSQDTVKNFTLNNFTYVNWPCYLLIGLQKPVSLSLPPNGTIALTTGTFYANMNGSTSEICIFTSIPNGMNDQNVGNDVVCTTVIPVGLETNSLDDLNVFPNPASDYLNIQSGVPIEMITITNSIDQTLRKFNLKGEKGISTQELSPGIYFLQLESKDGIILRRFVIDR